MTEDQEFRLSAIWKGVDGRKYTWADVSEWLWGAYMFSDDPDDRDQFGMLHEVANYHHTGVAG